MQIFNHFRPNPISSAILIKTCPLEASPVLTALRYISLPVAKLFILWCWTDCYRTLSQTSQECSSITCEHAYIFINQAHTYSQKRTVFSVHGIVHLVWYYSPLLLKPFCYCAVSWCHRPQPNPAFAPAFSVSGATFLGIMTFPQDSKFYSTWSRFSVEIFLGITTVNNPGQWFSSLVPASAM